MTSGLDALKNRGRGERKRPIPPPKHSPRAEVVEVESSTEVDGDDANLVAAEIALAPAEPEEPATVPVESDAVDSAAVDEAVSKVEAAAPAPARERGVGGRASKQPTPHSNVVTAEPLTKKTISVGANEDAFLTKVVVAGMVAPGGKVDSNQSATIRLALRRLQADLTPEQVAEEIRRGQIKTGESGRPRF